MDSKGQEQNGNALNLHFFVDEGEKQKGRSSGEEHCSGSHSGGEVVQGTKAQHHPQKAQIGRSESEGTSSFCNRKKKNSK